MTDVVWPRFTLTEVVDALRKPGLTVWVAPGVLDWGSPASAATRLVGSKVTVDSKGHSVSLTCAQHVSVAILVGADGIPEEWCYYQYVTGGNVHPCLLERPDDLRPLGAAARVVYGAQRAPLVVCARHTQAHPSNEACPWCA